jgi:hypothetical protein
MAGEDTGDTGRDRSSQPGSIGCFLGLSGQLIASHGRIASPNLVIHNINQKLGMDNPLSQLASDGPTVPYFSRSPPLQC